MNTSIVSDSETARTDPECASQRSFNLATKGAKSVLELCVGPSLRTLTNNYMMRDIKCVGNDIDIRWQQYYPEGTWIIGDAMEIKWEQEWTVFAPPLSKGCTGKREDSLSVYSVRPSYFRFVKKLGQSKSKRGVLVLPARALATKHDRTQFFHLMNHITYEGFNVEYRELYAGRRRIRKYVDIYLIKE